MSLFIKILLVLLVIALAAPFVLKGPDGEPLMTLDEIQEPDGVQHFVESFSQIGNPFQEERKDKPASSASPHKTRTQAYSWRDEQGRVHYSNIKPTGVAKVEAIKVNPDLNVIKADKPPGEGEVSSEAALPVEEEPMKAPKGPGMIQVYTPEAVN